MIAGKLDRRMSFEKRIEIADGAGNYRGDFSRVFTAWGNLKYLRGGESVMAGRLAAKQTAIITIRSSKQSREVRHDWRVVIGDEHFNVRENPAISDDRALLEFLVESGVAVG